MMVTRTTHYQLNEIGAGETIHDDGDKFGTADRIVIDEKLYLGAEAHHHTGVTATSPGVGPVLSLLTGGNLAAGTTYYYKYSLVDGSGNESIPSSETSITTPAAIAAPGTPTLVVAATGGTLASGNYTYLVTAYKGDNRTETLPGGAAFITVGAGATNKITITFPSLPSGADGFNIYRRTPNGIITEFLISVALNVATPPTGYVDTGAVTADCDRTTPLRNRTSASAAIRVTLPGATPVTPVGYTWKIYRTTSAGSYTNSFLHRVVEYTSEATPHIIPTYLDLGNATTSGGPASEGSGSPSRILLTNGAEVQGELPAANISYFPYEVVFSYAGALVAQAGVFVWYCPFATATIVGVRATLGVGAKPAAQPVIVDVRKGAGAATPTFASIFGNPATRPSVEVGHQYSTSAVPSSSALVAGDLLIADIVQAGGGATPMDRNLTISVLLRAKYA